MAGTVIPSVRAAIVDLLGPLVSPVPVSYGHPGDLGQTAHVWLGSARNVGTESTQDVASMRASRNRRRETISTELVIEVTSEPTARKAEAKAAEIGAVFEEMVADDDTLGAVPNLLFSIITDVELDTTETGGGPRSKLTYTLTAVGDLL